MATAPLEGLAAAHAAVDSVVSGIGADQWDLTTPCPEWTVRQVLAHLVGGAAGFTARLSAAAAGADAGSPPPPSGAPVADPTRIDPLGDDPAAAHRAAAAAMVAAFAAPGALERPLALPIGTVPGVVAVHLRTTEALVHGWDLAHATGQRLEAPEPVLEQALAFSQQQLGRVDPARSPFGQPQPTPPDAPALDRLAALLGRSVTGA